MIISAFYWTIMWILMVIIWIAIAFWPARVAGRKGYSFLGFFILSIFFFPLALIIAYVVKDRNNQQPPTATPTSEPEM